MVPVILEHFHTTMCETHVKTMGLHVKPMVLHVLYMLQPVATCFM